jgi:hypothetical protein
MNANDPNDNFLSIAVEACRRPVRRDAPAAGADEADPGWQPL